MEDILTINNLTKNYGEFCLRIPSLSIPKGAIVGVVGENGAGKTTTIKAIFSLIGRESGNIEFNGKDIDSLTLQERAKLALCFDESTLPPNFKLSTIDKYGSMMFPSWDKELWASLISKLDLPQDKAIKQFSKGMKAKAQLAFALSHSPSLLVLDEITSSMDPVIRDEVLGLLQEFITDGERTVLLSSHLTSDLDKIADMIIFIHKGEILLTATRDQLDHDLAIVKANGEIEDEGHILSRITKKYSVEYLIDNKTEFSRINKDIVIDKATAEDILLFMAKKEE